MTTLNEVKRSKFYDMSYSTLIDYGCTAYLVLPSGKLGAFVRGRKEPIEVEDIRMAFIGDRYQMDSLNSNVRIIATKCRYLAPYSKSHSDSGLKEVQPPLLTRTPTPADALGDLVTLASKFPNHPTVKGYLLSVFGKAPKDRDCESQESLTNWIKTNLVTPISDDEIRVLMDQKEKEFGAGPLNIAFMINCSSSDTITATGTFTAHRSARHAINVTDAEMMSAANETLGLQQTMLSLVDRVRNLIRDKVKRENREIDMGDTTLTIDGYDIDAVGDFSANISPSTLRSLVDEWCHRKLSREQIQSLNP